jgi:hypothetical protein
MCYSMQPTKAPVMNIHSLRNHVLLLRSSQRVQMPQHSQICVHEPFHTILHACLLFARQCARRQGSCYTSFEAFLGEVVNGCANEALVREPSRKGITSWINTV